MSALVRSAYLPADFYSILVIFVIDSTLPDMFEILKSLL